VLTLHRNDGRSSQAPIPRDLRADDVLALLCRADGARSLADLAVDLGLALPTVLSIARFLDEQGLLGEVGGSGS